MNITSAPRCIIFQSLGVPFGELEATCSILNLPLPTRIIWDGEDAALFSLLPNELPENVYDELVAERPGSKLLYIDGDRDVYEFHEDRGVSLQRVLLGELQGSSQRAEGAALYRPDLNTYYHIKRVV